MVMARDDDNCRDGYGDGGGGDNNNNILYSSQWEINDYNYGGGDVDDDDNHGEEC